MYDTASIAEKEWNHRESSLARLLIFASPECMYCEWDVGGAIQVGKGKSTHPTTFKIVQML